MAEDWSGGWQWEDERLHPAARATLTLLGGSPINNGREVGAILDDVADAFGVVPEISGSDFIRTPYNRVALVRHLGCLPPDCLAGVVSQIGSLAAAVQGTDKASIEQQVKDATSAIQKARDSEMDDIAIQVDVVPKLRSIVEVAMAGFAADVAPVTDSQVQTDTSVAPDTEEGELHGMALVASLLDQIGRELSELEETRCDELNRKRPIPPRRGEYPGDSDTGL